MRLNHRLPVWELDLRQVHAQKPALSFRFYAQIAISPYEKAYYAHGYIVQTHFSPKFYRAWVLAWPPGYPLFQNPALSNTRKASPPGTGQQTDRSRPWT